MAWSKKPSGLVVSSVLAIYIAAPIPCARGPVVRTAEHGAALERSP
jgi:hypothetical protein